MPPVAKSENPWRDALDATLARNAGTDRPSTVRGLGTKVAELSDIEKASGHTLVKRIRKGGVVPTERTAAILADALGVPVDELPDPKRRDTFTSLRQQLAASEASNRALARREAEQAQQIAELRAALAKAAEQSRHPQELPKPGSRTKRNTGG